MPTAFTHSAVPLAMAIGLGRGVVSTRLLLAGVVVSVIPDLDVITFWLGIPYAAEFGHRGFSHSVLFALLISIAGACLFRTWGPTFLRSFLFLFVAAVSHGLLDAFTNGGLGVAFLWPWSTERFFAPVRVIEVAPFGISRLLSHRGAAVSWSELLWVWAPLISIGVTAIACRRFFTQPTGTRPQH
jgi:inner membrane protein